MEDGIVKQQVALAIVPAGWKLFLSSMVAWSGEHPRDPRLPCEQTAMGQGGGRELLAAVDPGESGSHQGARSRCLHIVEVWCGAEYHTPVQSQARMPHSTHCLSELESPRKTKSSPGGITFYLHGEDTE